MAAVAILIQPRNRSINSTILPIIFTFSETSSNTLNVVAQVQVWNNASMVPASQWVDYAGKMRCASNLNFPGTFYLNIEDMVNPLTDSNLYHQAALQDCYNYGDNKWLLRTFTDWEYYGNRLVRIKVQREYLDVNGIIQLDSTTTTSNYVTLHEGSPPLAMNFKISNQLFAFNQYKLGYDPSNADRANLFYLTNLPRYGSRPRPNTSNNQFSSVYEYRLKLKRWEDFPLCFFSTSFFNGQINRLNVRTYGDPFNSGIVTQLASNDYDFAADNDGMSSVLVGPKSYFNNTTPTANEGVDFKNVKYYVVKMFSQTSSGGSGYFEVGTPLVVDYDQTCEQPGYKRFAWRNQLGGWDMFTSSGEYKEENSIERDQFEKRINVLGGGAVNQWDYGKNNWSNKTTRKCKVTSQDLTLIQSKFFAEIGSSQQVYVMLYNGTYDPVPNFTDFNAYEDDFSCQYWSPVVITSKQIKTINTKEKTNKVSFNFEYSVNERFGRR